MINELLGTELLLIGDLRYLSEISLFAFHPLKTKDLNEKSLVYQKSNQKAKISIETVRFLN